MKRILSLALILVALVACCAAVADVPARPEKALTLMIYMCGSNLESRYGSASADIDEMTFSGVNTQQVNVLVMTGGSRAWANGQSADSTQIRRLKNSQMISVREQDAMNMGDKSTLTDFIDWSVEKYPAERYAMILWDHGAGPLEGICLDELNAPDRLSIDELGKALEGSKLPGKLSWIGFDACLMATAEVAKAMSPYAEYMVASQETEPADGWDYGFLAGIEADADGAATGKRIVDGYFGSRGDDTMGLTLSCLDLSRIDAVSEAMDSFFEPIGRSMDKDLFAELSTLRTQSSSFGRVVRGLTADGYDLVDLWDLTSHYRAYGESYRVEAALENAVTYKLPRDGSACGLSVYHPLRNKAGYQQGWKQVYSQMGISPGYLKYLNSFGTILTGRELADWSQIALSYDGFGPARENLYSLQLTPLQQENFASAQLIILGAVQSGSDDDAVYNVQLSQAGAPTGSEQNYYPVLIDDVTPDEGGGLHVAYTGRSLYLTDVDGNAMAGPIGYQRSEDGEYFYIKAVYYDWSGREDAADYARVLYTCVSDGSGGLKVVNTEVYDSLTETYTRRIAFDEADYTDMYVDRLAHAIPDGEDALPAFADWDGINSTIEVVLPLKWRLRFFDEQMSGTQLFATLQVTDVQQNSYCTPPIPVENPNLYNIGILPRQIVGNGFELTLYAVQDSSPLNPGLNIGASFRNISHQAMYCDIDSFVLNGHRTGGGSLHLSMYNVAPGQTVYDSDHLDRTMLAGLGELTELSFELSTGLAGGSVSDAYRCEYSVSLSGCDASVTGGEAVEPIDEVVRGDETWQLLDLRRNARGGLSGTLRVVNDGEKTIYGTNYCVINDTLQTDETLYFDVDPHMDVCIPFEIENSIYGHDLVVKGAKGNEYRYLGIDHLMERFGITGVTSLKLCRDSYDTSEAEGIAFEWEEPIPIADPGELDRWQPLEEGSDPLLDGAFTVVADRVLAADDGVALRLLITNHSSRDLMFALKYTTLDGQPAYLSHWHSDSNEYAVGAGATLIANVSVEKRDIEAVGELGMCFRYGDYTTHSAGIVLGSSIPLDAEGGTYFSGSEVQIIPVDNARAGVDEVNDVLASIGIEDVPLHLTVSLTNDEDVSRQEDVDGSARVAVTLRAENRSDAELRLVFSDFVINGTRCVSGMKDIWRLKPGETGKCVLIIPGLELFNLNEIRAVDCTARVQRNGDLKSEQKYPVHFELSGLSLSGDIPKSEILCESKEGGLTLRLMSLRENERGKLEGVLYLRNDSDALLESKYARPVVNGVTGGYFPIELSGGMERYISFTFDNELSLGYWREDFGGNNPPDMSHLLQRMGIGAVYSFGLLTSDDADHVLGGMLAELEAPLPLSPWDTVDMAEPKPLLEGEAFVGVTHAAMTSKGLFLTLVLRNDSTEPLNLGIVAADGDDRAMEIYYGNREFLLSPGITRVLNARFETESFMAVGERLEQVSLSFSVNGELAEGATLRMGGPMTVGQAGLWSGEALDTTPAAACRPMPVILESVGAPGTESVYPSTLIAPVDAQAAERFVRGYASVCMRDESYMKDETGEWVEVPCLRELCRIPLARDGEKLAAPYSGMALSDGYDVLFTREAPLEDGGTELRVDLVLYSPDRPYDSKIDGLLSGRGYGVLMEGRWTAAETRGGAAIQGGEWTLRNLENAADSPRDIPLAEDGWKAYGEQTRYYGDDLPDRRNVDYITQNHLMFMPVQALDAELVLRYEIFYDDGESEVVIVDDGLAAIREAAEAQAKLAECLGELEPDGGGSIAVVPDAYATDQFQVAVSARLKLEDADAYDSSEKPQIRLGLCMKVENRSDARVDAVSTGIILNDGYETQTQWVALGIKPASACADTWYIEPEDLRAVGGVHRIRCTLNLCLSDDHEQILESIPIDVALEEMDEDALWERYNEVGETGVYGITWQLLSAEMDQYGRVSGKLRAVNHTNTEWNLSDNAVLANGYRGTSVLSDIKLAAQSTNTFFFSFENFTWADCYGDVYSGEDAREEAQTLFILQSHGVREVTELTFALGIEYDVHRGCVAPAVSLTFELPKPLSLPQVDYEPGGLKPLLQEDGLSVWLESVLPGDQTLSVALEVRNDTDEVYTLYLDHINIDGAEPSSWYLKEYTFSTILPHTTEDCCVTAETLELGSWPEDGIGDMHLCFWVTDGNGEGIYYRAAHVKPEVPLGQVGETLRADNCDVQPAAFTGETASGLTDELCLPPAARVHPRTLTPQLSGEKAALFESGEASICIRYAYEEYEAPDLPCEEISREIAAVALKRDAAGTVSAQYSGLGLSLSGMPFPMRERTDGGETEISGTIYMFGDYFDAYEIRDPGTDGGTPDVVSIGEPDYTSDEPGVSVPAVKAELRYRVGLEGDGMALLGSEVSFVDMQTGKLLDGGVAEWDYFSLMISNVYCDDNYKDVNTICRDFGGYTSYYPSLLPVERFVSGEYYWGEAELVVRYHIRYADGSEEILVEPY